MKPAMFHLSVSSGNLTAQELQTLKQYVVEAVCREFGLDPALLATTGNAHEIVWCRHVCTYVLRTQTRLNTRRIASIWGQDHSSVTYAMGKVRDVMAVYPTDRAKVEKLCAELFHSGDKETQQP